MRCINNQKKICAILGMILMLLSFTGCGEEAYPFPYDQDYDVSSFRIIQTENHSTAKPFAADLCVVTGDITGDGAVDMSEAAAAVLCDVGRGEVLYSKNAHEQLYPASLTKIMTALVALKYGSMDQVLTASSAVNITDRGAVLIGLKAGDTMTLAQALPILMIYSANDVGMLIAENVGGSVEGFLEMMNEEAAALGATNTHFTNPHGLTETGHYTTAYDLYLMFNEAIKYDLFREIINMNSYNTVYYDKNGAAKEVSIRSTNRYFTGDYRPPDRITVIGGKTGTTNAAGHCLILLSRDTNGDLYISVILRSSARDILYREMTDLLNEIGK